MALAGHACHDNPLQALPPQAEACVGCVHCLGKPSNRTNLPDTMGNRRHIPSAGLPNLVATSQGFPLLTLLEQSTERFGVLTLGLPSQHAFPEAAKAANNLTWLYLDFVIIQGAL